MNDRYLFRAKRIDNGEWVEGFLFQLCYDSTFCWCIGNEPLSPNDYSELYGFNREWFYIDESTICQCTGLKDKNGKMIWENDIVFVADDDGNSCQVDTGVGEVDFLEGLWYISGNVQNALYDINKIHQIKVIGNIFDNPELLEQEGR